MKVLRNTLLSPPIGEKTYQGGSKMSKTKQNYLTNFTNYPKLAKKVLNQIGDWKAIKEYPENYLNGARGISGFIYYADTEKFTKRNIFLILKVLGNYQDETGEAYRGDQISDLNWLAWFACETITHEIYQYLKEST